MEEKWKVKTYWKCGRKLWNDMKNMEKSNLKCEDLENTEENSDKIGKIWEKRKKK